ncbi:Uncharacterised protein [Aedoeadaptatus ivorii]|uniref:Uncharacterized protein n=1 Tax=Aedoeadaptatus ivorii TaxID=54006 RepID=A0A3S4ZR13_9FIRM|nr:hypothetical protein [Peptoniphilus ivorii]VEJ35920.1 Uncharacterised protein [Peptoniphilus ivorii]
MFLKKSVRFAMIAMFLVASSTPVLAQEEVILTEPIEPIYKQSQMLHASHITDSNEKEASFGLFLDQEGNQYGATDFDVNQESVVILDNANNKITRISGQKDKKEFPVTIDHPAMVSEENNNIYILDIADKKVEVIQEDGISRIYEIDLDENEAISEFEVVNGCVYITYFAGEEQTTAYVNQGKAFVAEKAIDGRISNGYIYTFELDEGSEYANNGNMNIFKIDGKQIAALRITSKNPLGGAKLLGMNGNGNYIISKTVKIGEQNKNLLTEIDANNNVINEEEVETKVDVLEPFVFDSDRVYNLKENVSELTMTAITVEGQPELIDEESKLEISPEKVPPSVLASTTRSAIMNNARSYHTSFSWNCTNQNISSMSGYKKPRYIQGAGTYTCMPYCWGGFDSRSSFLNGLNKGGRAGNIRTSTSSKVANTYGLDCSGYVSRCWGLSSKRGTGNIEGVATRISYSSLQPGDALNKSGHVMLFEKRDSNGDYVLYESTQLNGYDRVSHTIRGKSSVEGAYRPIRYNGV